MNRKQLERQVAAIVKQKEAMTIVRINLGAVRRRKKMGKEEFSISHIRTVAS